MTSVEWFVYTYNPNEGKIEHYNVLGDDIILKELHKKNASKEDFSELLRREFMYYFRSKEEWEIVISGWEGSTGEESVKVDVYDQLRMNWQQFIDYCWNNM